MAIENSLRILGSNEISADQQYDGYPFVPNVVFNSDFTESSVKIFIGGFPLTLAQSDNGRYILRVILENGATLTNNRFIWGNTFYRLGKRNNKYIMLVNVNNSNQNHSESLVYSGIPLSMNNLNHMIFSRYETVVTEEAEAEIFIGGMPLLVKRYNNNWYLVVQAI